MAETGDPTEAPPPGTKMTGIDNKRRAWIAATLATLTYPTRVQPKDITMQRQHQMRDRINGLNRTSACSVWKTPEDSHDG